jgi:sugar transferase (PEP-CTERM/EpsH1 system associated)
MNILFLAPRLPFPCDTGGKIRTFNILKQIAKKNHVHLACFSFEKNDKDHVKEFERLGIEVSLVPMQQNWPGKLNEVLLNSLPFSIAKYRSIRMRQTIRFLIKMKDFDAIHVDHLHMAHYQKYFEGIPCFLDEHNVEYRILERCAKVEKSLIKRIFYQNEAKKMKEFEARKITEFQKVFVCSSDDQVILNKLGANDVHVIPNGVDTDYFDSSSEKDAKENSLVFTGSMDWLPNSDAITYFCKEILPLVWKKKNSVKLYVVGKNPTAAVKNLASLDRRVIVTGRVDDVRPHVQQASIFIVPLRIGGGTRLKILEAMAMRKAVLSTTIGAEGIEHSKSNIALADTPESFSQAVVDLLNDPLRVIEMGEEGRKLVCDQYDWSIVGQKLHDIYNEVAYANQ